jgi:hypothetical protein
MQIWNMTLPEGWWQHRAGDARFSEITPRMHESFSCRSNSVGLQVQVWLSGFGMRPVVFGFVRFQAWSMT